MTIQQPPTTEQVRAAWDGLADDFARYVTPATTGLARPVLRLLEVRPGTRLLDVGAGTGALSLPAARDGARVLATDLAPGMIEGLTGLARAEGLDNVEGRVMDGAALDLDDGTFDVAASMNGVSLFPDIGRGLAEMVRVTRRGGRVVLIAFGPVPTVEFIGFCMGAMKATVPGFTGLPTDPPPLPFQVADPEVMRGRLVEAGLRDVAVHTVTCDLEFESADHLWNTFRSSNPIGARFAADLTQEQEGQVRHVLDGMLRERSGGRPSAVLHVDINIGLGVVP